MARGGRRIGAGRKPKNPAARLLQHPSSTVVPPTTNEPSPVEEFDAPNDLAAEERAVWLKQSPHAFANGTLTRASAMSFERYCRVVVLERNEAKSSAMGGPNHRGLLKELRSLELGFMLTAAGKAMPANAKPAAVDEDDAFFGASSGSR